MRKRKTSLEYAVQLDCVSHQLRTAVVRLYNDLGENSFLLNWYLPVLMSSLGSQAFDKMMGFRPEEIGKNYLQDARQRLIRCGVAAETLLHLDTLARACFSAIDLLDN